MIEEGWVVGIAAADEILGEWNAAGEESLAVACDSGGDGGSGVGPGNEGDALRAQLHEMLGDEESRTTVVDADEVVPGAHGVGGVAAIEEHDGNSSAFQRFDDALVDDVLGGCEFERREEDSGDFLCDVVLAELLGLFLLLGGLAHRVTPEEGVRLREWGLHHAVADGFEDFGSAEVRDKQPEDVSRGSDGREDVCSRASAARDDALEMKFIYGFGDGDARGAVAFSEFGFAGETVSRLEDS